MPEIELEFERDTGMMYNMTVDISLSDILQELKFQNIDLETFITALRQEAGSTAIYVDITDPALRERIAKASWDADMGYMTSIPWPPASLFREGKAYRVADAIIAALVPSPGQ